MRFLHTFSPIPTFRALVHADAEGTGQWCGRACNRLQLHPTWPACSPGHASTAASALGDSASNPLGLLSVSIACSSRRSAKLYTRQEERVATAMRSLRSFTASTCNRHPREVCNEWAPQLMALVVVVMVVWVGGGGQHCQYPTLVRKDSSPMGRPWWSSYMIAFVGGYLGTAPPPTRQKMLQRNSISTIAMPPSSKSRRNCTPSGQQVAGLLGGPVAAH